MSQYNVAQLLSSIHERVAQHLKRVTQHWGSVEKKSVAYKKACIAQQHERISRLNY